MPGSLGFSPKGSTLYVTLEPCCTHGRTPPCTEAVIAAGVRRVVVGAVDPNPRHCGEGLRHLENAGVAVTAGVLSTACTELNEAFNHWIVHRTPWVTVKAGMSLDGKIATAKGESKWITGEKARAFGMRLRRGADAILAGINTILTDDPSLTFRGNNRPHQHRLRRIVLDSQARTPMRSKIVLDEAARLTTIVVSRTAPAFRVRELAKHVQVLSAPVRKQAGE
jgi:diaminohydroxyphosphoribosylaminopyrimidine deaminase / 5-amino-6-(5-phosphoribosylamino)uracil reductase